MMSTPASTDTVRLLPTDKRRRHSTYQAVSPCYHLPHSLEALDLSYASITPAVITLRLQLLTQLTDLEKRLSVMVQDSPIAAKGEQTMDDVRAWARDGLALLRATRNDLFAHLPELHLPEAVPAVESFVRSHMPRPSFDGVRAALPDMPGDLAEMVARLEDVRARVADIDVQQYLPTLPERLQSLQAHLASMEFPYTRRLGELLSEGEEKLEKAATEVARAMKQSLNGTRLIHYMDLPEPWRNNPFVKGGYRFIPLHDWPRLLLSVFTLHNETLNIHTHFIPFLAFLFTLLPFSPDPLDAPVRAFTAFALLCLFSSSLWHTMAGCGHFGGMDLCARIDYIGIGWLISASVGTVVYYGLQCDVPVRNLFLALCFAIGLSGSVCPFMAWFNEYEYRLHRIVFFVSLSCAALAPLAFLAFSQSVTAALAFIAPLVPSLLAYVAGLVFYATHFPECYFVRHDSDAPWHWLDWLGGGSHAIWHVCIVLAIALHKRAMAEMSAGFGVCAA